jgi:hypothetical protein
MFPTEKIRGGRLKAKKPETEDKCVFHIIIQKLNTKQKKSYQLN